MMIMTQRDKATDPMSYVVPEGKFRRSDIFERKLKANQSRTHRSKKQEKEIQIEETVALTVKPVSLTHPLITGSQQYSPLTVFFLGCCAST
jgi:hypothetical protein